MLSIPVQMTASPTRHMRPRSTEKNLLRLLGLRLAGFHCFVMVGRFCRHVHPVMSCAAMRPAAHRRTYSARERHRIAYWRAGVHVGAKPQIAHFLRSLINRDRRLYRSDVGGLPYSDQLHTLGHRSVGRRVRQERSSSVSRKCRNLMRRMSPMHAADYIAAGVLIFLALWGAIWLFAPRRH